MTDKQVKGFTSGGPKFGHNINPVDAWPPPPLMPKNHREREEGTMTDEASKTPYNSTDGSNTMSKHDDGGPAFPVGVNIPPGHFYKGPAADPGMSLHAFYAGLAMQSLVGTYDMKQDDIPRIISKSASIIADAMIAEMRRRDKTG